MNTKTEIVRRFSNQLIKQNGTSFFDKAIPVMAKGKCGCNEVSL